MTAATVADATPAALVAALAEGGLTVATAESLTGGLVAVRITDVPGASAVFRGGLVAYATPVKAAVLGVPEPVLAAHGPVAPETAGAMAAAARAVFAADLAIATTGVAGPDPVDDIPPGVAFVAAQFGQGVPQTERLQLPGGRAAVREACAEAALQLGLRLCRSG